MKKYMISRFVVRISILGFCIVAGGFAFWVWAVFFNENVTLDLSNMDWESVLIVLPIPFFIVGLVQAIYMLLFDYMLGKFSVSSDGITMYIGFKQYYHPWNSFQDYGVGGLKVGNDVRIFWAYFATRKLTMEEKRRFFSKTRKDLKNIAFFQYTAGTMDEILPLMPYQIAQKIREDIERAKLSFNRTERRYHR